ncbi:hypothetical protein OUZ56_031005 [Daphnia magna]|uniref:Uncharacterized protein n=1 Tax=Daphnia magna TaxID=35525 RepID=A0ABQ9ZU70_9CRUS|nr:hypothetical protein OUZ56_031005 [Daphnia magna]
MALNQLAAMDSISESLVPEDARTLRPKSHIQSKFAAEEHSPVLIRHECVVEVHPTVGEQVGGWKCRGFCSNSSSYQNNCIISVPKTTDAALLRHWLLKCSLRVVKAVDLLRHQQWLHFRTVWFNTGSTIHFLGKLSQKRAYEVAHSLVGGLSNAWKKLLRKVCDGQTVQFKFIKVVWTVECMAVAIKDRFI